MNEKSSESQSLDPVNDIVPDPRKSSLLRVEGIHEVYRDHVGENSNNSNLFTSNNQPRVISEDNVIENLPVPVGQHIVTNAPQYEHRAVNQLKLGNQM